MKYSNLDKDLRIFLIALMMLVLVGIIMVYSASYIFAKEHYGTSLHFLKKQVMFLALGGGGLFLLSKTKFSFWYRNSLYLNACCVLLLLLALIPGTGVEAKGSYRWLNLYFFSFQPGELTKYSLLLCSVYFFENFFQMTLKEKSLYLISFIIPLLILLKQPDFGTFVICLSVVSFVCFLSNFPRKFFYGLISSGVLIVIAMAFLAPYRVQRILTYLDPWKDPHKSGFQIIQSYLGLANGAFFGQGIGNSNEKLFYLPEAHNDFIFSVIGEELGFIGLLLVVGLFISFIYFGFRMGLKVKQRERSIFICSVVFTLGFQAFVNMGVVLGLLPTKGLNLPFISSGGSSLISNLLVLGLVLSAKSSEDGSTTLPTHQSNFVKDNWVRQRKVLGQ